MAKFNWSKTGNYTVDPARYQRGDDADISPARKRRRKRARPKVIAAPAPVKAPKSNPNKRGTGLSPEIMKCQALDRRYKMRWSDTPEGAKIRAQDERKRLKKLARKSRKSAKTVVKIKRHTVLAAAPEVQTRHDQNTKPCGLT